MKTYIYIISDSIDIKVGISKNPTKRIKQLQTGSSKKLFIINTYQVDLSKAFTIEKKCHDKLSTSYEKRGEWFKDPVEWDLICTVESIIDELF
jgi:hypothetical protein